MDTSQFVKAILTKKQKPKRNSRFESIQEELDWTFGNDYRRSNIVINEVESYCYHEDRIQSKVGQLHGDFHSNYPYTYTGTLRKGVFYHEYQVKYAGVATWSTFAYGMSGSHNALRGQAAYKAAIENITARANIAMADKILKDRESWDVLTDFAELRETSGFLRDCGESLVDILQGIASRNPARVLKGFKVGATKRNVSRVNSVIRRHLGPRKTGTQSPSAVVSAASSLWLGYRYGLMPILYSAEDAALALSSPGLYFRKRYQVTIPDSGQHYRLVSSSSGKPVNVRTTRTARYVSSCRLIADVDYSEGLASRLGYSRWQPLLTLYEAVPFSFLLDWFYDIAGWFQRLRLSDIVGKISCIRNLKEKAISVQTTEIVPRGYGYEQWRTVKLLNRPWTCEERVFTRTPVSLTTPPPVLGWGLDKLKRQIDTIALSASFLVRFSKGIPK